MIRPQTTIPSLLGAALSLTGCAGEPAPVPTHILEQSLEAFCMKLVACGSTFPYYDPERCFRYADAFDFEAQYLSGECLALFASYYNCLTPLPCEELRGVINPSMTSDSQSACEDELKQDPIFLNACYSMLPPPSEPF